MRQHELRAVDGRRVPLSPNRSRVTRALYQLWLSLKVALTPPPTVPPEQAGPLQLFLVNGMLNSASDHIALTFTPLLALALGASFLQLGMLAGAASLAGALSLLLASLLTVRSLQHRKSLILLATGTSRLTYLALALLPLLIPSSTAIGILIALWAARAFLSNLINPIWASFSAALVPRNARDAYLHNRNDAMNLAAILALPIAGLAIRLIHNPGYPVGLALAFLAGLAGAIAFARIPPPTDTPVLPRVTAASVAALRLLKGERTLLTFCAIGFLWNLSLHITSPFLNVYLVVGLNATALGVGILAAVGLLFGFASSHVIAEAVRYRGPVWVMRLFGLLIPLVPWAWTMATATWQIGILNAVSGILWAGYNLAAFRALMRLTPGSARPQAAILYQIWIFLSACIGALIGGMLVEQMGFRSIFLVSGAGRLLATALLWMLIREIPGPSQAIATQAS
ncbi:MAG: MFS transporter [Chloroflexi bacterium]|nr:MFS transporter [Chloroflexota bacterium]